MGSWAAILKFGQALLLGGQVGQVLGNAIEGIAEPQTDAQCQDTRQSGADK